MKQEMKNKIIRTTKVVGADMNDQSSNEHLDTNNEFEKMGRIP